MAQVTRLQTRSRQVSRAWSERPPQPTPHVPVAAPGALSETTRLRLGLQLQAMYEPVVDEPLDPRLAYMIDRLDEDRRA